MRVGVPREIKLHESRIALLPNEVSQLVASGHSVMIETGAGSMAGATDEDYRNIGAVVVSDAADLYVQSDMIVKVKEPMRSEFGLLRSNQHLIANLYCERDPALLDWLVKRKVTAIAAEKAHPVKPGNSPLAGEIAALEGVRLLLLPHGGAGRHFMRHAGVEPARALVMGLGLAGRGALRALLGLGVRAIGLDHNARARVNASLDWQNHDLMVDDISKLPEYLPQVDLVINCVRWNKARKDHLIRRSDLRAMRPRSVIVDVSCDRAGAIETSMPTTWENPTYQVGGITHFCVENLPGAAPAASSASFSDLIFSVVQPIADEGLKAIATQPWLAEAVITHKGQLVHERVAQTLGKSYEPLDPEA